MAARRTILRLVPGGQPRRRCANCQRYEHRAEELAGYLVFCLAGFIRVAPATMDTTGVMETADALGLRERVETEIKLLGKEGT